MRLSSIFTSAKNGSAVTIIETLVQKMSYGQEKLWILKSFTLEGMIKKEMIRKEVLDSIFKE